jgi:hypothetical protein
LFYFLEPALTVNELQKRLPRQHNSGYWSGMVLSRRAIAGVVGLLCAWGTQVAAYHVAGGWWDSREEALIVQRRRQSLLVIGEHFSQALYLVASHGE